MIETPVLLSPCGVARRRLCSLQHGGSERSVLAVRDSGLLHFGVRSLTFASAGSITIGSSDSIKASVLSYR